MTENPPALYAFQEEIVPRLIAGNFLLSDACGLGKTIDAVETVKRMSNAKAVLVVCPRHIKEWWAQVILERGAGRLVIAGTGGVFDRAAPRGTGKPLWAIVHPTGLRMNAEWFINHSWDLVIVDEAHRFKNRKAKQTKALWKVPAKQKWALTATPYGRDPSDMWALLHWLYPKGLPHAPVMKRRLFTSYWRFFNRFVESFQPRGQKYHIVQGGRNLDELARLIAPFYRRLTKDEAVGLDLPLLTHVDVPVVISGAQEELYLQLVREAYAELAGKEIILENVLVRMVRLHQCALDPALCIPGTDVAFPTKSIPAKVEWLHEWLLDHPDENVVIVSRYRKFVELWFKEFTIREAGYIVGGMSDAAVKKQLGIFRRTGRLIGSLAAVCEGLNLQRASTMIIMDGTWSPTKSYQLAQRIHRIGQERPCHILHLVGKLEKAGRWTVDRLLRKAQEKRMTEFQVLNAFVKEVQSAT